MYIGFYIVWKRILQSLGIISPGSSGYLKERSVTQTRVKPPEFDSSKQVRVLLFRELNGQERRLLFDSKAVRKKDPMASSSGKMEKPPLNSHARRKQDSSIEKSFKLNDSQSKEYIYEWQKSSSDEQMLREMIFGAVSISYQGATLKVHTIRSPPQIMLSVVFPAPPIPPFRAAEQEAEESGTWNASAEINIEKAPEKSETHLAHSVPVNVPSRLSGHYGESRDSDSDSLQSHDGYSSLPTTHLTPETTEGCLPRSSSYNSLQRRLLRNKATSIELGLQNPDQSGPSIDYSSNSGQKRVKLGLSIVINLNEDNKQEEKHFNDFLFTHMSLIEGHLMRLKNTVVRAYLNRRTFVHCMFEGSKKFQKALNDLYTAPRLQTPDWLTIISSSNHRHLSYSFLGKLVELLKVYDKKETHFFVSTLLTAVLTHHLAWVPSVIPTDSKIQSAQSSHKHTPHWVDLLAKSRPYNPLWVQLSDLYGALGIPLTLTKTVVKGQRKEVVMKFLQVLSYFIRCSDICEYVYEKMDGSVCDTDSLNLRWHSERRSTSVDASSTSSKLDSKKTANERILSTPDENCNVSCCKSKPCLPKNLCVPQNSTLHSTSASSDADCASDSSKDTCDVTITPEERTSDCSAGSCSSKPTSESPLVPITSEEINVSSGKSSELDSLGYMSLEEKLETVGNPRRFALKEHVNYCEGPSVSIVANSSSIKDGKENNPMISVSCTEKCGSKMCCCCIETDPKLCKPSKSNRCCDCKDCPCYGNRPTNLVFTKELGFSSPKVKECESIEEGYHSMEEPHSPSGMKMQLSEMLKRFDNWCPEGLEEMPLPELQHSKENISSSYFKSFGWSLMAGISDHYLTDFCLQGITGLLNEEEVREDLIRSTHIHVLGEPVSEAVCIVADTDKWNVQLLSSNCGGEKPDSLGVQVTMSSLVSGLCDAILNMSQLGISPELCIIYLEDRLQELYTRSQMLSDYLRTNRSSIPLSKVASTLNVDVSDMPLLLSIATTHSPNLSVHNR